MTVISRDISQLEKVERLNLINSCTGYKSANLIATKSVDGAVVAIFSSITHLGSNPALIGFVFVPRRFLVTPTKHKSNRVFYSQSYN
jgi:hypothetical protein